MWGDIMKKILLTVICMFFSMMLSACTDQQQTQLDIEMFDDEKTYQIDESESEENLIIHDQSEVVDYMTQITEEIEREYLTSNSTEFVEFPLNKEDITTQAYGRSTLNFLMESMIYTVNTLLENTVLDIKEEDDFYEGTYTIKMGLDEHFNPIKDTVYKAYINEGFVYIERYSHDLSMTLDILKINFKNDQLSFEWYVASYSEATYMWHHVHHVSFVEGQTLTYTSTSFEDEKISSYSKLQYNMENLDYIYIRDERNVSSNEVQNQFIEYHDIDQNITFSVLFKNDEVDHLDYSQYNADGKYLYYVSQGITLEFEYNLLMMDGWDKIDMVDDSLTLFYQNQAIHLPEGVTVNINKFRGFFLEGEIDVDQEEIFNLESCDLESPISYAEMLVKNQQIIIDAKTIFNEHNQYENKDIFTWSETYLNEFDLETFYALVADRDHH